MLTNFANPIEVYSEMLGSQFNVPFVLIGLFTFVAVLCIIYLTTKELDMWQILSSVTLVLVLMYTIGVLVMDSTTLAIQYTTENEQVEVESIKNIVRMEYEDLIKEKDKEILELHSAEQNIAEEYEDVFEAAIIEIELLREQNKELQKEIDAQYEYIRLLGGNI